MYYIDAHTHLLDLSIASLKEMSLHNIRGVISPVHLGAFKPVSKDTIIDVWDVQHDKNRPTDVKSIYEPEASDIPEQETLPFDWGEE